MGQQLIKLYEFAEKTGGVAAKMRLAMMTGISSQKTADTPDSPEVIDKVKTAIKTITGKEAPV